MAKKDRSRTRSALISLIENMPIKYKQIKFNKKTKKIGSFPVEIIFLKL